MLFGSLRYLADEHELTDAFAAEQAPWYRRDLQRKIWNVQMLEEQRSGAGNGTPPRDFPSTVGFLAFVEILLSADKESRERVEKDDARRERLLWLRDARRRRGVFILFIRCNQLSIHLGDWAKVLIQTGAACVASNCEIEMQLTTIYLPPSFSFRQPVFAEKGRRQ